MAISSWLTYCVRFPSSAQARIALPEARLHRVNWHELDRKAQKRLAAQPALSAVQRTEPLLHWVTRDRAPFASV